MVSMRSVSTRLGVSPVPLYSRVGNKDVLVDVIADRLLADLAPPGAEDETWEENGGPLGPELRGRLRQARDSRLTSHGAESAYVEASLSFGGGNATFRICPGRGDAGRPRPDVGRRWLRGGRDRRQARASPAPGSPRWRSSGVTRAEIDILFDFHVRYVIEGIAGDVASERAAACEADQPWWWSSVTIPA